MYTLHNDPCTHVCVCKFCTHHIKENVGDILKLLLKKYIIIIICIIKTSRTYPKGKTQIVYKLLLQPHKHMCNAKLKNTT